MGVESTPKIEKKKNIEGDVENMNNKKLSVSVRDCGVYFKKWLI